MARAIKVSKAEVERLRDRVASMRSRMSNVRKKAEVTASRIVSTGTIAGTAFGFGVINGRFTSPDGEPGIEILGAPLELVAGFGMHLLAFGAGSKYATPMHDIGNGALAAWATTMGASVGQRMLEREAAPATAGRGRIGRNKVRRPLTDAELMGRAYR